MVKSWACCLYFTMPPPARFVARRCIDPALKGPNRKAQGNALGIEGDLYDIRPERAAQDVLAPSGRSRKRRVGTVPSLVPRALPGAFLFGPFRARNAEAGGAIGPAGASDPVKTNFSSTQPRPPNHGRNPRMKRPAATSGHCCEIRWRIEYAKGSWGREG